MGSFVACSLLWNAPLTDRRGRPMLARLDVHDNNMFLTVLSIRILESVLLLRDFQNSSILEDLYSRDIYLWKCMSR